MAAKFPALLVTVIPFVAGIVNQDEIERTEFQAWNKEFKKSYASSLDEKKAMKNVMAHKKEIEAHNVRFRAGLETYSRGKTLSASVPTLSFSNPQKLRGLWEQSDLSFDEQEKLLAGSSFNASQFTLQGPKKKLTSGQKQVNWLKAGLVNSVQNQGRCGSCFAFAAVGVAEGVLLKKGIKTRLSVQQIVDCDKMDDGCKGLFP